MHKKKFEDLSHAEVKKLASAFTHIHESDEPKYFVCPACNRKGVLKRLGGLLTGPYGGLIKCSKCDFRDSVVTYLRKNMCITEKLHKVTLSSKHTFDRIKEGINKVKEHREKPSKMWMSSNTARDFINSSVTTLYGLPVIIDEKISYKEVYIGKGEKNGYGNEPKKIC